MTLKYFSIALTFLVILHLITGCESDDNEPCNHPSAIILENNICLVFEHEGLSEESKNTVEDQISSGLAMINNLMPIKDLRIRIVDEPMLVISEIGIGGYNPDEQEVIIAIDTNFSDLTLALEEDLIPILAHEIHHAKRRRFAGYGSTLLQAAVSEGLADHFSIEVTSVDPPPWSVALTDTVLQNWIDSASIVWHQPYNHGEWFVGTGSGIPRWTGYSIGFELVKNYLLDSPNSSASNLYDEPASSFEP